MPVQPRACGELPPSFVIPSHEVGSAPRVRGTRAGMTDEVAMERFSPARAGNSHQERVTSDHPAVQPRACGELRKCSAVKSARSGSAPRVRGTRFVIEIESAKGRFSPARAGNSCAVKAIEVLPSVQPRACGELISRRRE